MIDRLRTAIGGELFLNLCVALDDGPIAFGLTLLLAAVPVASGRSCARGAARWGS